MSNKLRVSVYLRNKQRGPSDYYRIEQYLPLMGVAYSIHDALTEKEFSNNLNMRPGIRKKLYQGWLFVLIHVRRIRSFSRDLKKKPDVVIVQRETIPHAMGIVAEKLLKKLVCNGILIWDFDDDIFSSGEISHRELRILSSKAKHIVVTSEYLSNLLIKKIRIDRQLEAKEKMVLLPTTDGFCKKYHLEDMFKRRERIYEREFCLVWVGTNSNLHNLHDILPRLDVAACILKKDYGKELVLKVVCNTQLKDHVSQLKIKNIEWNREVAEKAIEEAHMGIMPLNDSLYSLGKGGFKLVQYISAGLPVIASSVGFNKSIVTEEVGMLVENNHTEVWVDYIIRMATDQFLWRKTGKNARERYEREFSYDRNLSEWKKLVRS